MLIGLTGGIGSGKTTIANALRERGYEVYDTDSAAKRLVMTSPVRQAIENLLGEDVYDGDRYISSKVAQRVFANAGLLQQLNDIIHPVVRQDLKQTAQEHNKGLLFVESAILYESGFDLECDYIIAVIAPKPLRIARTMARDNKTEEQVKSRIKAQMSNCQLRHRADYVVENNGKMTVTQLVDKLMRHLRKKNFITQ
ncbi:MAG: dephospho-CoA kinase [Paludibacteraceae bacterium]|nr:dephospho-CoA kinase [Paludibacteraceae bacterium]